MLCLLFKLLKDQQFKDSHLKCYVKGTTGDELFISSSAIFKLAFVNSFKLSKKLSSFNLIRSFKVAHHT